MKHPHSFGAALLAGLVLAAPLSAEAQRRNPNRFNQAPTPAMLAGRAFAEEMSRMHAANRAFSDPQRSYQMELLQRPDVQRALVLTLRQKDALAQMRTNAEGTRERVRSDRRNRDAQNENAPGQPAGALSREERQAARQQRREQIQAQIQTRRNDREAALDTLLTPEQRNRLRQLDLQWRGPMAILSPIFAEPMGLTPEQTAPIQAALQEFRQAQGAAMQEASEGLTLRRQNRARNRAREQPQATAPEPVPTPQELRSRAAALERAVEKARREAEQKTLALLSPEQRQLWKSWIGPVFLFRVN